MVCNKRILIVEDDSRDIELILASFNEIILDCKLDIVNDGEQALDYVFKRNKYQSRESGSPLFIMLDLKMPKIDGLDVVKQLKESENYKHIPIVIFTSSKMESDLITSYNLGVNAYVVKPVEFEKFEKVIKEIGSFWAILNETI